MESHKPYPLSNFHLENLTFNNKNITALIFHQNLEESKEFLLFENKPEKIEQKIDKSTNTIEEGKMIEEQQENYSTNESLDSEDEYNYFEENFKKENKILKKEENKANVNKIMIEEKHQNSGSSESLNPEEKKNYNEEMEIKVNFDVESNEENNSNEENFMNSEFSLDKNWGVFELKKKNKNEMSIESMSFFDGAIEYETPLLLGMCEEVTENLSDKRKLGSRREYKLRRSSRIIQKRKQRRRKSWRFDEFNRP